MVHSIFTRNFTYPLFDFFSGCEIIKRYKELNKTQWFSDHELQKYQEKKIRALITHVYHNVPFYRNLLKENHLKPSDFKTIADICKIPVIDKQIIKKSPNYPECMFSCNINKKKIIFGQTSGTTGIPLIHGKDQNARSFGVAAYLRGVEWMGLSLGDYKVSINPQSTPVVSSLSNFDKIKKQVSNFAFNQSDINELDLLTNEIGYYINKIQKKRPKHLHGIVSLVIIVAHYIQNNSIEFPDLKVSTTSEVLEPIYRKYLNQVFNGQVFDQYGSSECNSIAFECVAHEGLHIASEHVLLECTKKSDQVTLPCDTEGEAIITDLDNFFMPLIRYKNGDVIKLTSEKCSCGRKLPLIKQIKGRLADFLQFNDLKTVQQDYFFNLFDELGWYKKFDILTFQVIQISVRYIELNIVTKVIPSKNDINILINQIQEDFIGINVNIKFVDSIPFEVSGKFRYIKKV